MDVLLIKKERRYCNACGRVTEWGNYRESMSSSFWQCLNCGKRFVVGRSSGESRRKVYEKIDE